MVLAMLNGAVQRIYIKILEGFVLKKSGAEGICPDAAVATFN
jgi:hypothetical protein